MLLWNAGDEPFRVERGFGVGQLVIAPLADAEWEPVESDEALGPSERGLYGFGHTGRRD